MPRLLGTFKKSRPGFGVAITVYKNRLVLAEHNRLTLIDVSDPQNLETISTSPFEEEFHSPYKAIRRGSYTFIAYHSESDVEPAPLIGIDLTRADLSIDYIDPFKLPEIPFTGDAEAEPIVIGATWFLLDFSDPKLPKRLAIWDSPLRSYAAVNGHKVLHGCAYGLVVYDLLTKRTDNTCSYVMDSPPCFLDSLFYSRRYNEIGAAAITKQDDLICFVDARGILIIIESYTARETERRIRRASQGFTL